MPTATIGYWPAFVVDADDIDMRLANARSLVDTANENKALGWGGPTEDALNAVETLELGYIARYGHAAPQSASKLMILRAQHLRSSGKFPKG